MHGSTGLISNQPGGDCLEHLTAGITAGLFDDQPGISTKKLPLNHCGQAANQIEYFKGGAEFLLCYLHGCDEKSWLDTDHERKL